MHSCKLVYLNDPYIINYIEESIVIFITEVTKSHKSLKVYNTKTKEDEKESQKGHILLPTNFNNNILKLLKGSSV